MDNTKKKINIAQIMLPKVSTAHIKHNASVRQGMEMFRYHGYTAIPVVGEEGEYLGCVSEGDFLRHVCKIGSADMKDHEKYKIKEIYRPDFCEPLHIQADIKALVEVALKQNFVPIIDDRGYFCGIVTRRSLIEELAEMIL